MYTLYTDAKHVHTITPLILVGRKLKEREEMKRAEKSLCSICYFELFTYKISENDV